MAEQEKAAEGRRRREDPDSSLGRPGEVLLCLLIPGAGILVGWAPAEWGDAVRWFTLRLPVSLHQVPMTAEGGQIGVAQLYTALPVDELGMDPRNVAGWSVLPTAGDLDRLHAQACRQRTSSGLLVARSGGRFPH